MDTVFKLQEAQLYCSEGAGEPDLVAEGPLVVVIDSTPTECAPTIRAQVADVFWSLGNEVACVKLNEHTYCFNCPDSPGLHLSLLLPLNTPNDDILTLQSVLSNSCLYNGQRSRQQLPSNPPTATAPQPAPPEANKYEKVATGLVWGGAALSQGIRIAAAAASSGLQQGARLATQHLDPAAQPMAVSETTMKRLVAARDAATKAAHLTGQVAQGVASVIIKVASGAVHAAEASGITKGLSKAGVDTNSLGKVGSAGVTALEEAVPLQVFTALETAGESVLHSLSSATTTVVHHRCGAQAATATQLGMGAAISVVQARRNLNVLRPTRMLRNTAKHTAVIAMKAQGGAKAAVVVEPEHRNGTADAKLSAPDRLALTNGQALQGNGAVDGGLWRPEVTELFKPQPRLPAREDTIQMSPSSKHGVSN
ncbi:hypothetical protein QJQ45_023980 [Haematococcus lacustris]|nr:hypothetical protein QJQ45_023980 [Haematococcus lacustris]